MPGEHLDLSSEPAPRQGRGAPAKRRYIGVHFTCCDVYRRIYIDPDASSFIGHCPRCAGRIEFRIGPDGSDSKFFTAG